MQANKICYLAGKFSYSRFGNGVFFLLQMNGGPSACRMVNLSVPALVSAVLSPKDGCVMQLPWDQVCSICF